MDVDKTKALLPQAVTEINTGNEYPLEEIAFLTPKVGHETQYTFESVVDLIAEYILVFGLLTIASIFIIEMELDDGTMLTP